MMSSILYVPLALSGAVLGLVIGFWFKPLVLWIVTAIVASCALFVLGSVLADGGLLAFGGMIFFGFLIQAIALLLAMWITHFMKRSDGAWWKKVKEKTLD